MCEVRPEGGEDVKTCKDFNCNPLLCSDWGCPLAMIEWREEQEARRAYRELTESKHHIKGVRQ